MKTRTFIAVALPGDIRSRALQLIRQLQPVAGDVKWVAPENLHFTLQFLGDVPDRETPAVCDAVAEAVAPIDPFQMQVRGAGAFPAIDRPKTLWLGAGQGTQSMVELQAAVERCLGELGFRGEARRYVPHLTIGRAGRGQPPRELSTELAALADFNAGTLFVDEVTVFASRLTPAGSEYSILAQVPLAP